MQIARYYRISIHIPGYKINGGLGGRPPGAVVDPPLEKCQHGVGGRFWTIYS